MRSRPGKDDDCCTGFFLPYLWNTIAAGVWYRDIDEKVEIQEESVLPGDVYLLCSDGLTDMVEDEDIHLTISTFGASLETVSDQLIELANENGGRDNITVTLAEVKSSFALSQGMMGRLKRLFR